MGKRIGRMLWGIFFLAIGIGLAGSILGAWTFRPFFAGWWTLLIIVPSCIGIIEEGPNSGNLLGLIIGGMLFACTRGYLDWDMFWKMIVPIVFVAIGLGMVLRSVFCIGGKRITIPNEKRISVDATFGGRNARIETECFGVDADAVFGGLTLDLRNATITQDISVDVNAIFGGVDIYVPSNVKVIANSNALFGGCNNHRKTATVDAPIIYVNSLAMFGGVEIK